MPLGHKLLHGLIQSHSISFERITARVIVWDFFFRKKLPALFISCQQIIVVSCSLACTSNESINLSIYLSPHLSLFLRGPFDLNFSTLCCKWSQFLWKDVWSSLFYVSLSGPPHHHLHPAPACPVPGKVSLAKALVLRHWQSLWARIPWREGQQLQVTRSCLCQCGTHISKARLRDRAPVASVVLHPV